ncbi:MAG: hypothetical protein A3J46_03900 [Candidatus Yanofskybacteria bacterium RIFCSPHIGHO2_02_FULL_41_11]|uniref:Uncharacterized protein n=1 Tax=Candidatus Yanofskybacteria bacterium RIFCSPHIGHO2_02_FULL_41_11 TaxID=1802675 RepID=A0A1F8F8J7_9BACT|nr:MAG: hypothetical protein A3J46_03900 [Candidatus Yanofskybacteria bacterium RIFCSPHIGHO2_02_FULL_41_11]
MNNNINDLDNNLEIKKEEAIKKKDYLLPGSIIIAGLLISGSWVYSSTLQYFKPSESVQNQKTIEKLQETVLPTEGVTLPVRWGDLGVKLAETGTIDLVTWENLNKSRGGTPDDIKNLFSDVGSQQLKMTPYNAQYLLNIFWALGLGNKSEILEKGPMMDKQYGGADKFASTGGWSLAKGKAMDHYSKHNFINLTPGQQAAVERISKNIYRPCCGNSTYFPDCNHGMAMLGLLELMASQGVSEKDMYKTALQVNAYWFPDTYLTIARYFEKKGTKWNKVNPQEVLGANFSSSSGYQKVLAEVEPVKGQQGGSCGV